MEMEQQAATPLQELKEGLTQGRNLSEMVGLQHIHGTLSNLRNISHARRRKILGLNEDEPKQDDEMFVGGDYKTENHFHSDGQQAKSQTGFLSKLALTVAGALAIGTPIGAALAIPVGLDIAKALMSQPTESEPFDFEDTNTQSRVSIGTIEDLNLE